MIYNNDILKTIDFPKFKYNIIFNLIAYPCTDLTIFEILYIVHNYSLVNEKIHSRLLSDVYMKCGCFNEAENNYNGLDHFRKLGDIAWAKGDLKEAELNYLKEANSQGKVFRGNKDWDRLIRLYFYKGDWDRLINILHESNISNFDETSIFFGKRHYSFKKLY